jgi:hypothetical protein
MAAGVLVTYRSSVIIVIRVRQALIGGCICPTLGRNERKQCARPYRRGCFGA